MNEYKYGNANGQGVYVDYYSVVNLDFVSNYDSFTRLANALLDKGDKERAVEVLDRALMEYPLSKFNYPERYGISPIFFMVDAYYAAGAMEKGDALLEDYANTLQEYIEYYLRFDGAKADLVANQWVTKFQYLDALANVASAYGRTEQYEAIDSYLDMFGTEEEVPASDVSAPAEDSL
jgi:tetratricopeptide (TPR) repeat protein